MIDIFCSVLFENLCFFPSIYRWITVPQLVNAFYVITKNEIGKEINHSHEWHDIQRLRLVIKLEKSKKPARKGNFLNRLQHNFNREEKVTQTTVIMSRYACSHCVTKGLVLVRFPRDFSGVDDSTINIYLLKLLAWMNLGYINWAQQTVKSLKAFKLFTVANLRYQLSW